MRSAEENIGLAGGRSRKYQSKQKQRHENGGDLGVAHGPKPRLETQWGEDAAQRPAANLTVVRGIAHKGSISVIFGKPKSGKSFLATDLGRRVADEWAENWMSHRIKAHGPVLTIACEGHGGYWARLRAGGPVEPRFGLTKGRPILITTEDGRYFVPHPDDIIAEVEKARAKWGCLPVMVIIDTVFRSFGGGNVNASDHMSAYIAAAQMIADLGIAVVLIHHTPKNGTLPAGSIVLIASADTLIAIEKVTEEERTWCVEEAKDDAGSPKRKFRLEVVDIERDEAGDLVQSCRVIDLGEAEPAAEGKETNKGGRPANKNERDLVLEILRNLVARDPAAKDGGAGVPSGVRSISVERWRDEVYRKTRPGEAQGTKQKAFKRMVGALTANGTIGVSGTQVWAS